MNPRYLLILVAVIGGALAALYFNLWRALLFFRPSSIRIDAEDPGAAKAVPDGLRKAAGELEALGFSPLGTHSEQPPLGPLTLCWNFQHEAESTVATLFEGRDGTPHLRFLSVLSGGGYALTANYRRPAREVPGRYASGYLEDIPVDRVFKAHTRRLAELPVERAPLTLEGRVEAERAWYGGPGKQEVRQQHVQGLLWSLGTLGMVAAAIFAG